ncbi:MAG: phosphatidate cytidylyltransferase [Bacteroidetes bacterium]|nr:phosphatidate cytidylyltransferase [Bacteroidota bacterium]
MNNLATRTISGAVFVVIIIGSVLWHPIVFCGVFWVISMLGLKEFYGIVEKDGIQPNLLMGYFAGSVLYLSLSFFAHHLLWKYTLPVLLLNFPLIGFVFLSALFKKSEKPFTNAALTLTGILYIPLPLALLNYFYYPGLAHLKADSLLLISLFSLIWINDTFAYLSGMLFGRHLLFPRISPKKTWEGSLGGAIFSLIAAWCFSLFSQTLSFHQWTIFAILVIVFGSLGDLTESMLKRSYGLKDSGNIMPGHGGVLDRFDATLGAAPVAFFFLLIIKML